MRKGSVFGVFLFRIFPHPDQENSEHGYISRIVTIGQIESEFSPNTGEDRPEKTPYSDNSINIQST